MLLLVASGLVLLSLLCPSGMAVCWFQWRWIWSRRRLGSRHRRSSAAGATRQRLQSSAALPKNTRKPAWVRRRVLRLAIFGKSCRAIEQMFNREHGAYMTVGHSWVAEYIQKHAAEIAERRKAMRRCPPRFLAVGHTWALDLTFMVNAQGFTFAMLGIIDHGSRRLLCLKHLPRKCTLALLGHLFLTMARCGVPAVIRTDNESMFASTMWRTVLAALGICHRRSQPGCPWQNGRIERLFCTLKPLLKSIKPNTAKALRAALKEFSWFYNHVRVHQNLQGLTPMEAWNGRTLADVQQAHMQGHGRWVQALDGHLTGYYVRCW